MLKDVESKKEPTTVPQAIATWSPKRLNDRQRNAIRMAALGTPPREISQLTGYNDKHVYRLLATDEAQEMLASFRANITHTIEDTIRDLVPGMLG